MTEYRIVRDNYLGYEVQSRRWWWPFWVQGETNTFPSVESAERYARELADDKVVKRLGNLSRERARP